MKLTSTAQANLMNKTYEIMKPMQIEELERAKKYAYCFTDEIYKTLFLYCLSETIRRKTNGIWE